MVNILSKLRQLTGAAQAATGSSATTDGQRRQMGEDHFGFGGKDES